MLNLKPYWIKSPRWIKWIFPSYIWHISTPTKTLFLTFDDGPDPNATPFVLDQLKKHNAKATFFCIGDCAIKHPKLLQRIKNEGHQIGNHTQHHLNGWDTDFQTYCSDIIEAEQSLYDNTFKDPKLFRPPYGKSTKKQRRFLTKKGYKSIMWSTLSADFDHSLSNEKVLNNVIKNTKAGGSIIIFHDSLKMKSKVEYCLPKVLEYYKKEGYIFSRIDASML